MKKVLHFLSRSKRKFNSRELKIDCHLISEMAKKGLLMLLFFWVVTTVSVHAQSSGATIDMAHASPPTNGTGWTYASNVYTINNGANVTIKGMSTNQKRIVVAATANVNISLNDVTISGLAANQSPLLLNSGAIVNLTVAGSNILTAGNYCAGIQAPLGTTLTIGGMGSLTVTGGSRGAGIGGGGGSDGSTGTTGDARSKAANGSCPFLGTWYRGGDGATGGTGGTGGTGSTGETSGAITITGGMIIATGGSGGAGIGGGRGGNGGTGGTGGKGGDGGNAGACTTVCGGNGGAGGTGGTGGRGGNGGAGSTITVNGGIVFATGKDGAMDIGGGASSTGGTGGTGGAGGERGSHGSLSIAGCSSSNGSAGSTGTTGSSGSAGTAGNLVMNGNGIIFATNVTNAGNRTGGILFVGNNATGTFYGTNMTITDNVAIPSGYTLNVPTGRTLTISAGKTLTNNGTITNNGTLTNNGTIINNGTITNNNILYDYGTINGNVVKGNPQYTMIMPVITTESLPDGIGEEPYSQTFTATGTAPITWRIESGSLPPGLALNETTGILSGEPTTAGTYNFTVEAGNSLGSDARPYSVTITVFYPVIVTENLPDGIEETLYKQVLTASGSDPITWRIENGSLPPGLSLDETTGEISGVPTTEGVYNFTVEASNEDGIDSQQLSISIELEALPRYQIGAIPPTITVWHEGDAAIGFYVLTDTLKVDNVTMNDYAIDSRPEGKITFDMQKGRFAYYPDKFDVRDFTVTFTAYGGGKTITQEVKFTLMPHTQPEYASFGIRSADEEWSSKYNDYTIRAETFRSVESFNNFARTVYSYSIAGKELIFGGDYTSDKLRGLSGREDIEELNLYAEKLIIRDALHFKQTAVTIYARELIFDGENASINTTPVMWEERTGNNGANGANAGSINLYIKEFSHTKAAIRFILAGGKGQDVQLQQAGQAPGNGGNGGTLTSTIDVSDFCVMTRGSAGVLYNSEQNPVGAGSRGSEGNFMLHQGEFVWLHPNYITAVIKDAKDAYLNFHNGYVYQTFSNYTQAIALLRASGEWDEEDSDHWELSNAEDEMRAIMLRINQNMDYFGNPTGWVPMLSFEANKQAFEQEIPKAIQVMYLSYWLNKIERSNDDRIKAFEQAKDMVRDELTDNKAAINKLLIEIPTLEARTGVLEGQIDELIEKTEIKQEELVAKAKSNIKKQEDLNKKVGIFNAIAKTVSFACNFIPVVGPAISQGVGIATSIGNSYFAQTLNATDTYGIGAEVDGFLNTAGGVLSSGGFASIGNTLKQIGEGNLGSAGNSAKDAYNKLKEPVGSLMQSVEKLHKIFTQTSTPNDKVEAELNRLMAESKEFQELIEEAKQLNERKIELIRALEVLFENFATTSVNVQKNIVAVDGLNRTISDESSKRDLRAMQYLDDMDRRAKERLLKYHYYMAKSYEYRLLEPYPGVLDLNTMFERFTTIAESDPNKRVLDANDFKILQGVYDEQLSTVASTILKKYNDNRPEIMTPKRFSLETNELEALNSGRDFNLNLFKRGLIDPKHENARIVNIKIYKIKAHLEGDQNPSYASIGLLLEHSGISMIRNLGEIYWFNHINSQNTNPITWSMDYDVKNDEIDEHGPSAASQSLLYSLLKDLKTDELMIYSRPGAWADIRVSKTDSKSSAYTKMIIDELSFELQYDFSLRPSNNRNVDVYAVDVDGQNSSLTPYIEISRQDRNERKDGRVPMYRTYDRNTGSIKLTAPEEYGLYKFVNWTNRFDNSEFTKELSVTRPLDNDQALVANYKYMGPTSPVINTTGLLSGSVGVTYNQSLEVTADPAATLSIEGILPQGLNFIPATGTIAGVPAIAGTFTFTVKAVNEAGDDGKEFTIVIDKGTGATVAAPTLASMTHNSITINAVSSPANDQTVEYAISNTNVAPLTGWHSGLTFAGLNANTAYYIFARAAENSNYFAGAASTSLQVKTDQVTGSEIIDARIANIYPNPTGGMITLEFETEGVYIITFTDLIGKVLLRETVTGQTAQVNISEYPAGVYLLTIDDGKRQNTTRIVKN